MEYVVTSPEGREFVITAPEGASEDEILAYAQQNMSKAAQSLPPSTPKNFVQDIPRQVGLTARHIIEGGASPFAALANAPAAASNALFGTQFPEQNYAVSQALDKIGLPRPANGLERVVGDAAQALTGTGATAKIGQAAPALASLADDVALQAKSALGSSVASGSTREAGGGTVAQTLAGLAGGMAAGKSVRSPVKGAEEMRRNASKTYANAAQKGGVLKPEFTNSFIDEISKLSPQTQAGKIMAGSDDALTRITERANGLRDKPISLAEAQEIDEYLGEVIDGFTEMGRVTKQGKKILDVQSKFRQMIDEASPNDIVGGKEGFDALKSARKEWSKSAKLSDIERIIQRAELMDNPAQGIKSGFRTMLANPNRLRGFNEQEQAAIKKAAESGIVTDALRVFGSRLIPIVTIGSGGGVGSALAAQGATALSRTGATKLQMKRADALARLVSGEKSKVDYKAMPRALGTFQGLNNKEQ